MRLLLNDKNHFEWKPFFIFLRSVIMYNVLNIIKHIILLVLLVGMLIPTGLSVYCGLLHVKGNTLKKEFLMKLQEKEAEEDTSEEGEKTESNSIEKEKEFIYPTDFYYNNSILNELMAQFAFIDIKLKSPGLKNFTPPPEQSVFS